VAKVITAIAATTGPERRRPQVMTAGTASPTGHISEVGTPAGRLMTAAPPTQSIAKSSNPTRRAGDETKGHSWEGGAESPRLGWVGAF
jgi:hypothetical protein